MCIRVRSARARECGSQYGGGCGVGNTPRTPAPAAIMAARARAERPPQQDHVGKKPCVLVGTHVGVLAAAFPPRTLLLGGPPSVLIWIGQPDIGSQAFDDCKRATARGRPRPRILW
jgi:hypothetical protein